MDDRTLIININTFTGEYINLNLPVEFVKRLINNNCFDFFYYREDAIDCEKFLKLVKDAFNYELTGYIGEIKTVDNNHIELMIE
ncbi:hypothetical protein [Clostridium sp. 2218st1_F5_2218SCRN_220325]|uniref:hypothetical protein n=1 Tax=Clostridia TaxID=186801 RepID=UPI0025EA3342|nr:hypothetical protein [uncultured Intestinibacter sp.]